MDPAVLPRIKAAYQGNTPPSVQLQQLLAPDAAKAFQKALASAKWKHICIPDRYSMDVAALPAAAQKILKDANVFGLIKTVTGKTVTKASLERFSHRDYTLRNDEEAPPGLYAYLDWTANWGEDWGGETIAIDEDGEGARIEPIMNTLVLVDCTNVYPFVRYVNHRAGKQALLCVWFS